MPSQQLTFPDEEFSYADFGPTLAREKLAENHGIVLGKETLRRLMIKTGLWVPRKQRAPKIQQPRYRRACCGELIQIDGCDHHWFENRAPARTALVYVDDVSGIRACGFSSASGELNNLSSLG